jgi:hypothetical protein
MTRLVELAAQGAGGTPSLAQELADVLLDWPESYPVSAREPFIVLLGKTIRDVDDAVRATLAQRFLHHQDAPLTVLNELFFAAPAEMKDEIIGRNCDDTSAGDEVCALDEVSLVTLAREHPESFDRRFADALNLRIQTARDILQDSSGRALALALKGAAAGRATYSTIAVLVDRVRAAEDSYLRLASFDIVPPNAARRMLSYWRTQYAPESAIELAAQ